MQEQRLRHLAAHTELTRIAYGSAYAVPTNAIRSIVQLTRLRELRLDYLCEDIHLEQLAALGRLTSLRISGALASLLRLPFAMHCHDA